MLTVDTYNKNKDEFITLIDKLELADKAHFLEYLNYERVDYFNKPYNLYEAAYPGGLCEYTLKYFKTLCQLQTANIVPGCKNYTAKQLAQVAVFKNLYKAELYEMFERNVKNPATGDWETTLAFKNKEVRPVFGDIGFSSYMIAKNFDPNLDTEVIEAITMASLDKINSIDMFNIRKAYPLVTLAIIAELMLIHL